MQYKHIFAEDTKLPLELRQAAAIGDLEKVKTIVETRFFHEINAHGGPKSSKQTALHRACGNGHSDVALYLATRGANIEMLDAEQNTPIMLCERNNLHELSKELKLIHALHGILDFLDGRLTEMKRSCTNRTKEVMDARKKYSDETAKKILSQAPFSPAVTAAKLRSWTMKTMLKFLKLTVELKSIPNDRFATMAGFFLLENLIRENFEDSIRLDVLEYKTSKGESYCVLIINKQDPSSYKDFNLLGDKKCIIFDPQIKKIYFANDRPDNSLINNYGDARVFNTIISNRCPHFSDLSTAEQMDYDQTWQFIAAQALACIKPAPAPSPGMR